MKGNTIKLELTVEYVNPPIPIRSMDWMASFGDGPDAICEYGRTSRDAFVQLLDRLDEMASFNPEKLHLV